MKTKMRMKAKIHLIMKGLPDQLRQDHLGLVTLDLYVHKPNHMHRLLDMLIIMTLSLHITITTIMEEM